MFSSTIFLENGSLIIFQQRENEKIAKECALLRICLGQRPLRTMAADEANLFK